MPSFVDWIVLGDFNLYHHPDDRNRPGADVADMYMFNEAIDKLGLIELPLKGHRFTWTNKQSPPLLEHLDWVFTSINWTLSYPTSEVSTLTMETSDHTPCLINISTTIPCASIFHFENYWLLHDDFLEQVQNRWSLPSHQLDPAKLITAKFKTLRGSLRQWKKNLCNLKQNIVNVKLVLNFLNMLEECRDLSLVEWNFRSLLEQRLIMLLKQQKAYWKQRSSFNWVTLGDASTKFFHAHATVKHRRNLITQLTNDSGQILFQHQEKADLIWETFKARLGTSTFIGVTFDVPSLLSTSEDLSSLIALFS